MTRHVRDVRRPARGVASLDQVDQIATDFAAWNRNAEEAVTTDSALEPRDQQLVNALRHREFRLEPDERQARPRQEHGEPAVAEGDADDGTHDVERSAGIEKPDADRLRGARGRQQILHRQQGARHEHDDSRKPADAGENDPQ